MNWWETFWRVFAWFSLPWFAFAALSVIVVQGLLPRAWEAIRANPPHGPNWAHTLWTKRAQVYGALMALSLLVGALFGLLALLNVL
jgi:hypothetical protein